ncbi:MAG: hypothetical protein K9N47_19595 [Prosthecobacter sp.]|uniref:hypothetical protein n=1 Tax=Prosthecobacter sp. TaxID=1965333 RepID=UPI0025EE65D6|nr:hypothetical protein [Prosthecobacter sp.]MCF7788335.1 hypothetical protein [Prosthecobacter sp.]
MKTPWLYITFTPGLSPIRHRCSVDITHSGTFCQTLAERRAGEWVSILPGHEFQLSAVDLAALETAVTSIDFAGLSARLTPARGASKLAIDVHALDGTHSRVDGRILSYDRGYHDFHRIFEPAQRLWKLVHALLPQKEF